MEHIHKDKFKDKFAKLFPEITKLELLRKKYHTLKLMLSLLLLAIILASGSTIYFNIFFKTQGNSTILFKLVMAIIFFIVSLAIYFLFYMLNIAGKFEKKYKKKFKEIVLDKLLSCFDFISRIKPENLPNNLLSDGMVGKSGIDDAFQGCYKDVKFTIGEGYYFMKSAIKGLYCGPFSGVILNIEFNKFTNTSISLLPKSDFGSGIIIFLTIAILFTIVVFMCKSIVGIIFMTIWDILLILSIVYKNKLMVTLEDNDFHKKFNVESNDQIETRYILTPSFMERLKNLKTAFGGENIMCTINEGCIRFGIPTNKDLFEIGDFNSPATNFEQFDQFYNEITAICDIIEHFKLNEKTGL